MLRRSFSAYAALLICFLLLLPAGASLAKGKKAAPAAPAAAAPGALKVYSDVITKDAKTRAGLFIVHQVKDTYYYEIPPKELGREMFWLTEIAQLSHDADPYDGNGGKDLDEHVVRWTRRENKVYLRDVDFGIRAADNLSVDEAVKEASLEPIIYEFDVVAEGPDHAPVIDVTKLFTSDPPEFSVKDTVGGTALDPNRSYIDSIKAFPTNIEAQSMLTFATPDGSTSVLVHYSMVELPETPMMGRLADSRVGYFTEDFQDYGGDKNEVEDRHYITRFRLEKKDPLAPLSEPVKPIVYYLTREIPDQWRPYLKQAVESWNAAFELAGFKNAIICEDAPTAKEDPNWDPDDARYNVIRWSPTDTENAMGQPIADPRSGEVVKGQVTIYANVLKLAQVWYFVQASPMDPRAQKLPLPTDVEGELLEYIVTHEIGHTLGLQHNFKASSAFTIAQLRDPKFTAENGDVSSIMSYGRFNYVAQPGDGARLIPKIGPYDKFAIQWGYTPIPEAKTPDQEKPVLDKLAQEQVLNPVLRWGTYFTEDPRQQSEQIGDDPIEAARLGLKNIDRVAGYLVQATTKPGDDYSDLSDDYNALVGQRQTELMHVATLIGGVYQEDWHAGFDDPVYRPVPRFRQEAAMRFLIRNGFTTPTALLNPGIVDLIRPDGTESVVLGTENLLLWTLLDPARLNRLQDAEATDPQDAYPMRQMIGDLQAAIWSDLSQPKPVIGLFRRNLQRAYLQRFIATMQNPQSEQTDLHGIGMDALRHLEAQIAGAESRCVDQDTRSHLEDCHLTLARFFRQQAGESPGA